MGLMKKEYLILIILFLIGVSAASLLKAAGVFKANIDLKKNIANLNTKVTNLEKDNVMLKSGLDNEKQVNAKLLADKSALEESLKSVQDRLEQVETSLDNTKEELVRLNNDFNLLKTDNDNLMLVKRDLETKIQALAQEKQALQDKFNSLDELKKAIHDLKIKKRQERVESKKKIKPKLPSKPARAPKSKSAVSLVGNEGFVIRDGETTFKEKVKIEVLPPN